VKFNKSIPTQGPLADVGTKEIKSLFPADDDYFEFYDDTDAASCLKALKDLDAYIAAEGPFDAVIAFSSAASFISTYLLHKLDEDRRRYQIDPIFKCAVFISGVRPVDYAALQRGEIVWAVPSHEKLIQIPTANIWGSEDALFRDSSLELSKFCAKETTNVLVHSGEHEVPGSKSKEAITSSVNIIRRAIDMSLTSQ
jgi:hypothetical protein